MITPRPPAPPSRPPDLSSPADHPSTGSGLGPALLWRLLWAEWRHHPWRQAAAVVAVALGVALGFAVQLINDSALAEFARAAHATSGSPDASLQAGNGLMDEAWYPVLQQQAGVALASPVLDLEARWWPQAATAVPTAAVRDSGPASGSASTSASAAAPAQGRALSLLGLDALLAPQLSPGWLPQSAGSASASAPSREDALAALDPDRVWLNAAAWRQLEAATATATATTNVNATGTAPARPPVLRVPVRVGAATVRLQVAGRVDAEGPPMAVMDIAGAQSHFGLGGRLSRIDLRLAPGADAAAVLAALPAGPGRGALRMVAPDEGAQRLARLTRAYRVNLSVLALVALFTGGFLVFSVQSLAVARRAPQLALLGVLGLSALGRRRLVTADSLATGLLGATLGLGLGTALAWAALHALGGDLGSGLVGGAEPALQWNALAALLHAGLGLASAWAGGWWPARAAQAIAPAQGLKGLSGQAQGSWPAWRGLALMALAAPASLLPAWHDVPLGAYLGVAALLLGGISLVPPLVQALLQRLQGAENPVLALAVARAVDQRAAATAAVAGVVCSLALVVALTVMVGSFRGSLSDWLTQVLPADLYLRAEGRDGRGEPLPLPAPVLQALTHDPALKQVRLQRQVGLSLDPERPEAVLIVRDDAPADTAAVSGSGSASAAASGSASASAWASMPATASATINAASATSLAAPARHRAAATPALPWVTPPRHEPEAGTWLDDTTPVPVAVTEVMAALHGLRPGQVFALPVPGPGGRPVPARVSGIWRDYARQQGALVMARSDWQRLTGDDEVTDAALWLAPGLDDAARRALRARLHASAPAGAPLVIADPGEIRRISLGLFDRSFAVTRWLQAVALAIGLAGIAASFSAQVLARRREFGTLRHLGFTRTQVLRLVAAEGALWTGAGALLGLALGLVISAVLVKVVSPQSFHWSMGWQAPPGPLAALVLAAVACGALTAWLSGRAAAGADMTRAVKEDW